jgi:hypothetical protein
MLNSRVYIVVNLKPLEKGKNSPQISADFIALMNADFSLSASICVEISVDQRTILPFVAHL